MRMRRLFLAFFALISSCGPAPEGPPDTQGVARGTQPGGLAAEVAVPTIQRLDAPSPAAAGQGASSIPNVDEGAVLAGFAGSRFAVIDTPSSTLVFDAESATAFGVLGHALRVEGAAWDIWLSVNFEGDVLRSGVVTSADGLRMLVRTAGGVQAVDLTQRGAMLTGLSRADVRGASLSPDGETFAAWTDVELTVVRVDGGARVSYPLAAGQAPVVQWAPRSVVWTDLASARIVDLASWRLQTTEGAGANVTLSKDGSTAVVAQPSLVEVWRSGEARPAARVVTQLVTNVVVDETGRNVGWVEYSDEYAADAVLHTLETATAAHHHFASQAACHLTHEYLLGIENGELRTDGQCSPGCPSVARQSQLRTYDVKTGKVTKRWDGDVERPFNEEVGARTSIGENLAKVFGFDMGTTLPIKHHPSADRALVERPDALRLVDHRTGAGLATLERSADFSVQSVHFWPESGERVIGIARGVVVVWDTASGERVWASRR